MAQLIRSGATASTSPVDDPTPPVGAGDATPPTEPVALGVAAALSDRFGVSVPVTRAAFATLSVAGGFGLVLYLAIAAAWRDRNGVVRPPSGTRDAGAAAFTIGLLWEISHWWPGVRPALVLPVGLVATGVALGWRTDADGARSSAGGSLGALARVVGGIVVTIGGLAVLFGQRVEVAVLRDAGLALAVALAGMALVAGPSAVRFFRSFSAERDERVRAQERARVATHLHDSVLQTLTLIQKRADDPAATAALARHQERSLRRWLYAGGAVDASGEVEPGDVGWRAAAERMVGDVEDRHAVAVELVMVGDGDIDRVHAVGVAATLAAAREALVNAAKFSGDSHLSMYCELDPVRLEVFVRDRGTGFDLDNVGPDRHGIRDSILGRMRDVGGTATIRTSDGGGTEVRITLPVGDGGRP